MDEFNDRLPFWDFQLQASAESPLVEVTITPFLRYGHVRFEFSGKDTESLGELLALYEEDIYDLPDSLAIETLQELLCLIAKCVAAAVALDGRTKKPDDAGDE